MVPSRGVNQNRKRSTIEQVIDNQAVSFLEALWLCQETRSLPKPGGLLDQDSLFVHLMKNALQWQHERADADMKKQQSKQDMQKRR